MKIKTNLLLMLLLFVASCSEKSKEDLVTEWIASNAIPLKTVEAGNGFDDLEPLKDMVGDARIVSLGEPTHGNREVFQLKHRMIEYLVTELGFNIFALECPFGEAYDINRYVVEGIGDPKKALAGIYYWAWDTQEVLELLKWMRAYNANPGHKMKLKFYGFDPQDPERATRVMLEYIEKVDSELAKNVRPELGILAVPFSNPEIIGRRQYIPSEYDSLSLREIRHVMSAFDTNKESYIESSSLSEWTLAKQHALQVQKWIEACTDDGKNYRIVRDLGQAENIKWILDQEGDEAKMIVWAHNCHIANAPFHGDDMQGVHLRKWYGNELKIFGFFFNQGGFKSIDIGKPSRGMYDFCEGPAPEGTLEHVMASAGLTVSAVDLGQLPSNGPVYAWFDKERLTRHSGGGYIENETQKYLWPYKLSKAFDVLVFLDTTTPTQSIDNSDYNMIWSLDKKQETPLNTDFERNGAGEEPDGWVTWSKFKRLGVKMITSDENPYQGNQALMVHRSQDVSYGEIAPNVVQRIDAKPYHGKTIRFRAASRATLSDQSFAFLRLVIDPNALDNAHDGLPPLFDSLDKYRVESTEWKIYEIEATVPESANIISYGIYLRDSGTAWLDAVEIEIVEKRKNE